METEKQYHRAKIYIPDRQKWENFKELMAQKNISASAQIWRFIIKELNKDKKKKGGDIVE